MVVLIHILSYVDHADACIRMNGCLPMTSRNGLHPGWRFLESPVCRVLEMMVEEATA
jgi:hypothetical protein